MFVLTAASQSSPATQGEAILADAGSSSAKTPPAEASSLPLLSLSEEGIAARLQSASRILALGAARATQASRAAATAYSQANETA